MDDYEIIDVKFLLDWNENPNRFKFYYQKSVPRESIIISRNCLFLFMAYFISNFTCMYIIEDIVVPTKEYLEVYPEVVVLFSQITSWIIYGILFVLSLCAVWCLFEIIFIKPRFKINKSQVIYITDDKGLYIVNYSVGGHDCTSNSLFPTIVDRIVKNDKSNKLIPEYFNSVRYLDSYSVVSSSSEYVVLDIPEDNPIYDDINDFEIPSSTSNFNELRVYLEDNGGM